VFPPLLSAVGVRGEGTSGGAGVLKGLPWAKSARGQASPSVVRIKSEVLGMVSGSVGRKA
jgi:hypothetical protein